MNQSTTKTILLTAAVLGIMQGLMALVGGIVAANDASKDDIPSTQAYLIPVGEYWCGMIRRSPPNTNCDYKSLDRGWFKRVNDASMEMSGGSSSSSGHVHTAGSDSKGNADNPFESLVGYKAVLAYAILCGLGWITAGTLALFAGHTKSNRLALTASIIFAVLYVVFIGLFGAVWRSVRKVEQDCEPFLDKACPDFKRRMTSSSREFLAYSICSFVFIAVSIGGSLYGACYMQQTCTPEEEKGDGKVVELGYPGAESAKGMDTPDYNVVEGKSSRAGTPMPRPGTVASEIKGDEKGAGPEIAK